MVSVQYVLAGGTMRLAPAERPMVVAALTERGLSPREIGERIGITSRSVLRIRARRGQESAA